MASTTSLSTVNALAAARPNVKLPLVPSYRPSTQHIVADESSISQHHPGFEPGVGHFSEWSRDTKKRFFKDWQASRENEVGQSLLKRSSVFWDDVTDFDNSG